MGYWANPSFSVTLAAIIMWVADIDVAKFLTSQAGFDIDDIFLFSITHIPGWPWTCDPPISFPNAKVIGVCLVYSVLGIRPKASGMLDILFGFFCHLDTSQGLLKKEEDRQCLHSMGQQTSLSGIFLISARCGRTHLTVDGASLGCTWPWVVEECRLSQAVK